MGAHDMGGNASLRKAWASFEVTFSFCGIKSHLLAIMMALAVLSAIILDILTSWLDWGEPMSTTNKTISDLFMQPRDLLCEIISSPRSVFLLFLSPAVSTRTMILSLYSSSMSWGSRVVWGIGEVMRRSSSRMEFTSEDFPTLGFPINETRIFSNTFSSSSFLLFFE